MPTEPEVGARSRPAIPSFRSMRRSKRPREPSRGSHPPRSRSPAPRRSPAADPLYELHLHVVRGALSLPRAHRLNWEARWCVARAAHLSGAHVCGYLFLPSDAHLLVTCADERSLERFVEELRSGIEEGLDPVPGSARLWSGRVDSRLVGAGTGEQRASLKRLLRRALAMGWIGGVDRLPGLPEGAG